ncbi:MAG: glycogen debranching protein, partial [Desulfobacterales bacterium]|nr:glycogen debranching protein [Desulfobacterales bacterium]
FQDYSKELNLSCLESFTLREDSFGSWEYRIPVGRGRRVRLMAAVRMSRDRNGIRMIFHRRLADEQDGMLADPEKIRLIVRPDIEDRNFHHATKAYQGPESRWPGAVAADSDGFQFRPDPDRWLVMRTVPGTFTEKHEWLYGVERPLDAGRGLDTASDLFSPGWFSTSLRGGDEMEIRAGARETEDSFPATENTLWSLAPPRRDLSIEEGMRNALDAYIVDRAPFKSVIAGWPWFLDWGRDSLIFARGLVAAGRLEDAKAVVKLFAQYEENGTLPNMIKGRDAQNRNTSDAPLWFFAVCSDLLSTLNDAEFLEERCGDRSFREILFSMANAIIDGTPGGVRVDRDTGLIFSPAHFTWMDTNHPACSPRQGYPIEIQALWCNALRLLARIEKRGEGRKEKTAEIVDWGRRAAKVKASISRLFWLEEEGFLSDCLHALPGAPAADARPDNALRPNQLIAVTMGAVDDPVRARRILHNCEELLVPGAIRSLADRRLSSPLEIMGERSVFENPYHPYQGRYEGDEDSRRKPAYHNGTAWTWMFPSFCEAWALAYGREGRKTARSLLSSATRLINQGCIGHLPEIVDGDYPHTSRGCYAQAWGASELLRVWIKLG